MRTTTAPAVPCHSIRGSIGNAYTYTANRYGPCARPYAPVFSVRDLVVTDYNPEVYQVEVTIHFPPHSTAAAVYAIVTLPLMDPPGRTTMLTWANPLDNDERQSFLANKTDVPFSFEAYDPTNTLVGQIGPYPADPRDNEPTCQLLGTAWNALTEAQQLSWKPRARRRRTQPIAEFFRENLHRLNKGYALTDAPTGSY